ncbi:MAG TPA: dephospho-CoA kinase, partial [Longimicrobiales bacterium]|nr:dephospho-CoA kinase [Longimicrobiales bacterium]
MDALLEHLSRLLHEVGLWVVLAVTFTETAFFIGLLIPAEATILMAAFFASRGYYSVWLVLAATFIGGLLGDQTGFFLGRYGGSRLVARKGRLAHLWQKHEPRAARLFSKHASLSISLARFISFVRTLMPWFAGMSQMRYGKFLAYDIAGVFGWAGASVAAGYLAGESWEAAAQTFGRATALGVGAVLLAAFLIVRVRRRRALKTGPLTSAQLLRVALTGNIGSGKSSVLAVWRALGASVIDADELAHRALDPGTPGFRAVIRAFGPDLQSADGTIDRARLRVRVFNHEGERKRLEAIVHPEVARLREEEERKLMAGGATLIV